MNKQGTDDRRKSTRLEPAFVRVEAVPESGEGVRTRIGNVLDASPSGLAIQILVKPSVPRTQVKHHDGNGRLHDFRVDEVIKLYPKVEDGNGRGELIGEATVRRVWDDIKSAGLALEFTNGISQIGDRLLLRGVRQNVRVENQAALATVEIDKIHAHVQYLHECQLKLFLVALTVGAALGACYLTLQYHSSMLSHSVTPADLSKLTQWRLLMAALPGLMAFIVAVMVTTKIAAVARNESLLAVLKECQISGQYPHEYRGWEAAYRKLKFIWRSSHCTVCTRSECAASRGNESVVFQLKHPKRLPRPNVFHLVLFGSLGAIIALSLLAVANEIHSEELANSVIIGEIVGTVATVCLLTLLVFLLSIHLGRYSFSARKEVWADILHWCPYEA